MPLIDDYITQLATVESPADLNAQHADWLWCRRDDVVEAVTALNHGLPLAGARQFRPHIMTTSVGDASGILFVSANPGWNANRNAVEDAFRRQCSDNNRAFCSDFFSVYRNVVGGNRWWSRALLLAHLTYNEEPAPGLPMVSPPQRWIWAQQRPLGAGVGNVDLIPFHSTNDGFGTLQEANHNPAMQMLLNVANATLDMVLRLDPAPQLIFVGSALGAPLMDSLCTARNMVQWDMHNADIGHPVWNNLHRWVHPHTGTKVMTFPHQVFAGFAAVNLPPGFMLPLAAHVRAFINEPVG